MKIGFPYVCKVFGSVVSENGCLKASEGRGVPTPFSVKMSSRLYPDYQLGLLVFIVILVRHMRMK